MSYTARAQTDVMYLSTLLDRARAELGYTEFPAGSNRTKFAVQPYEVGVAWCGAFVDAMWAGQAGGPPRSCFSTPWGADGYKAAGRWSPSGYADPEPGWTVFYSFRPDRYISHVGIVEAVIGSGVIQAIEGNTSFDYRGSQDNGGVVARKVRQGPTIIGYGRNSFTPEETEMAATKLVRKTSSGEIAFYIEGEVVHAPNLTMPGLSELMAAGLVEDKWQELSDAAFDALPVRR